MCDMGVKTVKSARVEYAETRARTTRIKLMSWVDSVADSLAKVIRVGGCRHSRACMCCAGSCGSRKTESTPCQIRGTDFPARNLGT